MALDILSFKRAFTAHQRMALAAGNCDASLAAIEQAKDVLDSLYLGLNCEVRECEEFCTSSINEFISHCKTVLRQLVDADEDVTIRLSDDHYLFLYEKNGDIHMSMDGEHVTITNLTLRRLFKNLVQDIRNNPDLYGTSLSSYVHTIDRRKKIPALLLPTYAASY